MKVASKDERVVAREEDRLEDVIEGGLEGIFLITRAGALEVAFLLVLVKEDERVDAEGRLGFEGDRARRRDVFAVAGIGGGGICSRAETTAEVFLVTLFFWTTRRVDWGPPTSSSPPLLKIHLVMVRLQKDIVIKPQPLHILHKFFDRCRVQFG